jgi:hypothetical protein
LEKIVMKTQVALRLDSDLVELERTEAEPENRSLANFVANALADALMSPPCDGTPVLSVVDADLDGIIAIEDDGMPDAGESERLRHPIAVADKRETKCGPRCLVPTFAENRYIGLLSTHVFVAPSDGRY